MGKSTIKEVAKMAGVSIGTVSRYINGFSVKEKNKKHIEEAIKKLNFETNYLAQGLRSKKTNSIGVLVPDIGDIFVTQVIEGIETVLNEQNFSTIICSSQNQWNIESEKLDFLRKKKVDGIILMPTSSIYKHIKEFEKNNIPLVLIDRIFDRVSLNAVVCDNVTGSYEGVSEIIKRGHTKIGIINGPKTVYTAKNRFEGYKMALKEESIKLDNDYIKYTDYTEIEGYRAIKELMSMKEKPTAIFATNYKTTLGCLRYMYDEGLKIGEDISLLGYDQSDLFKMIKPQISVIYQPTQLIGTEAAKSILEETNNGSSGKSNVKILDTKLVITESIKKLK